MTHTEKEKRQLRLMLNRLDGFEQGQYSLAELVSDLEGLFYALDNVPGSWRQDFLHHWGKLEDQLAARRAGDASSLVGPENLQHPIMELRSLVRLRMKGD